MPIIDATTGPGSTGRPLPSRPRPDGHERSVGSQAGRPARSSAVTGAAGHWIIIAAAPADSTPACFASGAEAMTITAQMPILRYQMPWISLRSSIRKRLNSIMPLGRVASPQIRGPSRSVSGLGTEG
jgi:hypothetical protein